MSRRWWRRVLVIGLNAPVFVYLVFPGWVGLTRTAAAAATHVAVAAPRPTSGRNCTDVAARAPVRAYLTGQVCAPADFPYRPVLRRTPAGPRMTDPRGSCSSAVGDTGRSFDFAAACASHDYGYDLLRFFGVGGAERRAVDAMFGGALWASCRDRAWLTRFNCFGWAATFDGLNRAHSVLHRHDSPRGVISDDANVADVSGKAAQVIAATDIGLAAAFVARRRRAGGDRR